MSIELRISHDLKLPKEAVTQTFGILAKRGSGKTYTASVLAEEMLKARLQIVVADPTGAWWGLRAAANGKDEGLDIIVLGGEHGDIPLDEHAGEVIADLVVESGRSFILDLSLFRKGEQERFMAAFLETLYRRNRAPLHLFVDEADSFAPQVVRQQKGGFITRVLGAMEDIVRRGRIKGIGCTLITQRPAVLNKNVLTQIEVLVCLRMTAPQDAAAVKLWVEQHGSEAQCKELLASLPSLVTGTAWFWSPGWLDKFAKVRVRRRETFDSGATPGVGETRIVPKKLRAVDLAELREKMAATIEEVKENDPAELKRRIAELQQEVDRARQAAIKSAVAPAKIETRDVPVITQEQMSQFLNLGNDLILKSEEMIRTQQEVYGLVSRAFIRQPVDANMQKNSHTRIATPAPAAAPRAKPLAQPAPNGSKNGLQPRLQAILDALSTFAAIGRKNVGRGQLGIFCEKSPNGGAFRNDLGELRTKGLIDYPSGGEVTLTDAGAEIAQPSLRFRSAEELRQAWYRKLQPRLAALVQSLAEVHPESMTRENLAHLHGKSADGGAFRNDLGELRTLGLIDYPRPGHVAATDLLFPAI